MDEFEDTTEEQKGEEQEQTSADEVTKLADAPANEDQQTPVTSWVWSTWAVHLVMYIVFFVTCLLSIINTTSNMAYYFSLGLMTLWLFAAFLNAVMVPGRIQSFIALIILIVNPFLLPISIYTCSENYTLSIWCGIIYTIVTIAACPFEIGICVFLSSLFFAITQKLFIPNLNETFDSAYIIRLAIAYIGLSAVALVWRFLLAKLYVLLNSSQEIEGDTKPATDNSSKIAQELSQMASEHRQLKESIANHIVQLNTLIGYTREGATSDESK